MRIRTKLIFGLLMIISIACVASLFSIWQLKQISAPLEEALPEDLAELRNIGQLDELSKEIRYFDEILTHSARNFAFTLDLRWKQRYYAFEPELNRAINATITNGDEQDREIFGQIDEANVVLVKMETDAITQASQGNQETAISILESNEYQRLKEIYTNGLDKYTQKKGAQAGRGYENIIINVRSLAEDAKVKILRGIRFTVIFVGIILLISIFITVFIIKSITGPMNYLVQKVKEISDGSFNEEIPFRKDEIGELGAAFNKMVDTLQKTTVSRDQLSREIEQRKVVEESLNEQRLAALNLMDDAEEARIKAEKAEENIKEKAKELGRSNEELGQFAYVASHDLQEPLRMIASYLQLLEKRYGENLDKTAHEFIFFAVDGAKRMQKLIDALLVYSRVGSKAKPFEKTDVNEVCQIVLKNLEVLIKEKNVKMHVAEMPKLVADATQLTQLFQNLISNGIKFQKSMTPEIVVGCQDDGSFYKFWVKDNGIGIEPQYFDKIFTIFKRLHTREEFEGTGIGLSVCKKIIERHGGKIWPESKEGTGTTFYFTISKHLA